MDTYSLLTILICSIPTLLCLNSLIKTGIKPLTLLQVIFYTVFILPILLDIINNTPAYSNFPGFRDSVSDSKINLLYNIFVIFISYFNWFFRGKTTIDINLESRSKWFDVILVLITVLPLVAILFAPDPSYYSSYGIDKPTNIELVFFHSFVSLLTNISVTVCAYLIVRMEVRKLIFIMFLGLIVIIDFWLNGKRAIVLIFVMIYAIFHWLKNKNIKSIFTIIILLLSFSLFNNWYQSNIRDFDSDTNKSEAYENLRIDYFRDQRVKMVLYSILYPENMKILEHSGQSFLFDLTFYIPRTMWEDKPYPYAVYFTSAMYYAPIEDRGWGMTTSIYDELIANFGILGIIIFQMSLPKLFKKVLSLDSKYFPLYFLFLIILLLL